jgi:hypothetical protein
MTMLSLETTILFPDERWKEQQYRDAIAVCRYQVRYATPQDLVARDLTPDDLDYDPNTRRGRFHTGRMVADTRYRHLLESRVLENAEAFALLGYALHSREPQISRLWLGVGARVLGEITTTEMAAYRLAAVEEDAPPFQVGWLRRPLYVRPYEVFWLDALSASDIEDETFSLLGVMVERAQKKVMPFQFVSPLQIPQRDI